MAAVPDPKCHLIAYPLDSETAGAGLWVSLWVGWAATGGDRGDPLRPPSRIPRRAVVIRGARGLGGRRPGPGAARPLPGHCRRRCQHPYRHRPAYPRLACDPALRRWALEAGTLLGDGYSPASDALGAHALSHGHNHGQTRGHGHGHNHNHGHAHGLHGHAHAAVAVDPVTAARAPVRRPNREAKAKRAKVGGQGREGQGQEGKGQSGGGAEAGAGHGHGEAGRPHPGGPHGGCPAWGGVGAVVRSRDRGRGLSCGIG